MKLNKFQRRFYRNWVLPGRLHEARLCVQETDLHVFTDRPLDKGICLERIRLWRGQIEDYINYKDRRFLSSLKPIPVELNAPPIVREMARQSARAGVGPMAAVAGALAQFLGRALLKKGCAEVIVENGGDIYIKATRRVRVGLYAGKSRFSRALSLEISPGQTPLGIATSSGTVGHSLSFGSADSVTVIAKNAALADACATAVANRVSAQKDLVPAVAFARTVAGVRGVLVVFRGSLATWGEVRLA